MIISLIAAMSANHVIGLNNKMPWHLPADLQHFKTITLGKPVIMGRKTYQSIGKALPGRTNIVISHQLDLKLADAKVVHSLEQAIEWVANEAEIMIIGGEMIFRQAMPLVQRMYLTYIEHEFDGDTFFPQWDSNEWQLKTEELHHSDDRNPYTYNFMTLERISK